MDQKELKIGNVNVYKWVKIIQSAILIVLGALFFITALVTEDTSIISATLSISLGVVFAVYGLMNIFSGYLLSRTPINGEVVTGAMTIGFSIVLFINHEVLFDIFTLFVAGFVFCYSGVIIAYGVDKVLGKGTKKSLPLGVVSFVIAALLIALGIIYLYFYKNKPEDVKKYMLLIVGAAIAIVGVVTLIMLFIKIRNTNEALKEEQIRKEQEEKQKATSEEESQDVKIINISDLKKGGRKIKSTEKADEEKKEEMIVVEEEKEE